MDKTVSANETKGSSLDDYKKQKGPAAEFSGHHTNDLVDHQEVGDGGDTTDQTPRVHFDEKADESICGRRATESKFKLI